MERFRKVGFFVVFFFTLFQVMGNVTVQINDKSFVNENHEKEPTTCELFSPESGEQDDQLSVSPLNSGIGILLIKENIFPLEYFTDKLVDFSFWQPPKNN